MPKDMIDLPLIGRSASVRPESLNEEDRTIEVVWTTGSQVRRYSWMRDEEFDEELVVDSGAIRLDRLNTGAPFLDSHRSWGLDSVLGVVVDGSVRIDGGKGYATIRFSDRAEVEPIWRDIKNGIIRNVSVGYRVHKMERTAKDDRKDGGQRALYRAVDWEPYEISAVALPADPGAQTRSADSQQSVYPCVLVRAQETTLAASAANQKEADMPKPNPAADDQNAARHDGDAVETRSDHNGGQSPATPETPAAAPTEEARNQPVDAEAAAQRAIAAERQRTSTITSLCRRHGIDSEFTDDLIARGVSVDAARTAILDHLADQDPLEGRTYEPALPRDNGERSGQYRAALENALQHRSGAPNVELSDAGREFRGMTLMEMARHALERSGVNTRGMSKMELASAALGQRSVGYHTTGDFPAVLANLGNKTLRAAYMGTPRTFTAWARRTSLTDFRPTTRVQVSNAPQLEKVLEGAEFTYGTFGEASTQYALATYGRIIAFSRQMLINDDLGAFTRVANSFGARAAELEGDLVYAILLQNPDMSDGVPLFDAAHGNIGTAGAINEASLTEAYESFASQTDIDGTAISVSPQFIITAPGQRTLEARKLLTATTPSNTQDVNTYANALTVVSERRLLANPAPWFLAASTGLIDTIEYAYLDGQDGVFTETRNGFEVDGVEIKARLDFAASAIDHRGLFKNAGA